MKGARPSGSPASRKRRAAILEAARSLLREREADKVLVADVAAVAGVSVATVYNLVGPRDQLLVSVLDETVEVVAQRLEISDVGTGIEGCVAVLRTACDVVLSEPAVHRRVLGSLGSLAPGLWFVTGLTSLVGDQVDRARAEGSLGPQLPVESVVEGVQLGFRGALISWVFGQLDDHDLADRAELLALHVLANAAVPASKPPIEDRLHQLSNDLPGEQP